MRKFVFTTGEFYHVYNRGVDKRNIFSDKYDLERFFQSIDEFNSVEPIGSIYENSFKIKKLGSRTSKLAQLVRIIAYCANPNHYHLILEQVSEKGVEKFMQRLGVGYTNYFNQRYKRSGVLFQGKFKSAHIGSNEYLLHLSAYVNLNHLVHGLGSPTSKSDLYRSSWGEYASSASNKKRKSVKRLCNVDLILNQFSGFNEYEKFTQESLKISLEKKQKDKQFAGLYID